MVIEHTRPDSRINSCSTQGVFKVWSREPRGLTFQGVFEVKTIFLIMLRHYLPFHFHALTEVPWNFPEVTRHIFYEIKEICKNVKQ